MTSELDEIVTEVFRDAEWRDALRPSGTPVEHWIVCGPKNPEEAAIHVRESHRVELDWKRWAIARYEKAERELELVRTQRDALYDSLPKCSHCTNTATRAFKRGEARYCDTCSPDGGGLIAFVPDYPRAEPVRAITAMRRDGR
jgi:hypothetical protein